jgi:hypothetical protein
MCHECPNFVDLSTGGSLLTRRFRLLPVFDVVRALRRLGRLLAWGIGLVFGCLALKLGFLFLLFGELSLPLLVLVVLPCQALPFCG